MGSEGTFQLQPGGLYVIVSLSKSKSNDEQAAGPTKSMCNSDDGFEWGLYWSKSVGIGRSCRYKERNGTWQFEQRGFPSGSHLNQTPIEENDRIILALHIENMHENMANLLQERLGPDRFQYSQPSRVRSSSQGGGSSSGQDGEESAERSRRWLDHVLVVLNNTGFISLKEGTRSAGLIETEALRKAKRNVLSSPAKRTSERSENVIFDGKGLESSPNRQRHGW